MSRVLTEGEICERALRKIGAYSINDTAARAAEMGVARDWLDMLIGHLAGTGRRWWLVSETAPLTLQEGVDTYPLSASLAGSPGIQAIVGVWRVDLTSGVRVPITVARRQEWESRPTVTGGPPEMVHYDRTDEPTLLVSPMPQAPIGMRLDILFSRFPAEMSDDTTTPMPDFRRVWNLWVVTALAAELCDGPVRKAPADEVKEARGLAKSMLDGLDAWDAHEQADEPRRVSYNPF